MSTILFQQSSQPSMDSSHVVEATTMILKLVSPKPYNQKTLFPSWNLVQSPSSHKPIDDCFNNQETNNSYVHNQKSFILSQKSLEICTESLGSETGSDTSEDDTFFTSKTSSLTKRSRKEHVSSKEMSSRSFPPPLTTIRWSKPFQVRPRRQGGRLIIEAMETNLGTNSLIAERSHGRLRLTCWKTEEGEVDTENNENDKKELENNEEEMERNVVIENFQRVRRCNEDEHGDKGLCSRWEPCCWVAIS